MTYDPRYSQSAVLISYVPEIDLEAVTQAATIVSTLQPASDSYRATQINSLVEHNPSIERTYVSESGTMIEHNPSMDRTYVSQSGAIIEHNPSTERTYISQVGVIVEYSDVRRFRVQVV